jgi:ubiquinone/menaquinone biosynthesis C-methylase UbiE
MVEAFSWLLTALAWSVGVLVAVIVWRRLFAAPMPAIFDATLDTSFRRRHFSPDAAAERHGLGPGMRVLELGPAGGYLTSAAQRRIQPGGRLVCLDLQPALLRKLRNRLGAETPPLVCGNAQRLPFRDGAFDLVFVVEVMGEIPDKGMALREIRRVLCPGGTLAVSEAALLDPDYVRFPVLMRLAAAAGFTPRESFSQWSQYTQRFVSPTARETTRDPRSVGCQPQDPPQDLR